MTPRNFQRALAVACLAVAAWAVPAAAHAVLQSSTPAQGASLDVPPEEVVLTFTEPVHPQASSAEAFDSSGRPVSRGLQVSPDGRTVRVKLASLPRGAYTVRWKVVSRVDGHLTAGLLTFGVGVAAPAAATGQEPPWWQVAVRWLGYLAGLFLAGTLAFPHLVLPKAAVREGVGSLRALAVGSAAAVALTALLDTALRAAWLQSPAQGFLTTLGTLVRTSVEGPSVLLRVGAAALAVDAARNPSPWVAGVAGGAALLGFTVTSHAWATGPLAVAADWLHMASASVWVGGLPCLAVFLARSRSPEQAAAIARAFSWWAGYGLAGVVVTGAYAAALHVPGWNAVFTTGYGRWLAAKLALVVVLALLGASNRYRLLPRLTSTRRALVRLAWSVKAEVGVAALVLLAAGGLAITPPARTVQAAASGTRTVFAAAADGLRVSLAVDPAQPGWNRFELDVRDGRGKPVRVDRAFLRLKKLDEQTAASSVPLEAQAEGRYTAEGTYLGLPGLWEVELVLRSRGEPDRVVWFPLRAGTFQLRSELEAFRVLRRAQESLEALRTWRETEQITDGAGNVVVTRYTYQRPDRLAFEVVGGMQGILVGRERFLRTERGWQRDTLPEPFTARGPALYMQNPLRAALGRKEPCSWETCQVVLWESPDGLASFAAWVGDRTHRVYKLLMWAPAHFMTSVLGDFDSPVRVEPPVR